MHCMSWCTDTCYGWRDGCSDGLIPASTMVRAQIDNCTIYAMDAPEDVLSRACMLVCWCACSLLLLRRVCSSSALSATHGRPCATNTVPNAATVIISNIDSPSLTTQRPQ